MKTITRNITYYVAEDGTEFTSESKCEAYEKFLRLPEYYVVVDKTRLGNISLFSTIEDAEKFAESKQLKHIPSHIHIYPIRLDEHKK